MIDDDRRHAAHAARHLIEPAFENQNIAAAIAGGLRVGLEEGAIDFRGGKHTDLEGGVCVPFIARWPAKVPAGRVDDQSVISGADWLPSLCAITGISINVADFDGEDSSKALLGAVHVRTKPLFWKTNTEKSDPSMLSANWKLHGTHRRKGEVSLYDLATDPGEKTNLAEKQPDVLKRLTEQLTAWNATLPKTYEHGDDKEN